MNSLTQFFCLLPVVMTVATLALTSCQPKDVNLQAVQKAAISNQVPVEMSATEKNNLLAVSIERALEPLHLLRAIYDSKYAEKNGLKRSSTENEEVKNDEVKIDNTTEEKKLPEGLGEDRLHSIVVNPKTAPTPVLKKTNSEIVVNYNIDEFSTDLSGRLNLLVITKNIFETTKQISYKPSSKAGAKADDFISESVSEKIMVKRLADEDCYVIKITRIENTDSKKDKKTMISTEAKVKINWDGLKSSLNKEIAVTYFEVAAKRTGAKSVQFKLTDEKTVLTLTLDKPVDKDVNCMSINGRLNLVTLDQEQKMTNPEELVITDSTFEIPSMNYKSTAQPCESRPIVDLARML